MLGLLQNLAWTGWVALRRRLKVPRLPSEHHYAYIDALRGIAFLGVFALHTVNYVPLGLPKLLADVMGRGFAGVQLFYVVSAFTLCLSMANRAGVSTPLVAYFVRRLFRIAPMFWCAIALSLAFYGWGPRWGAPDGIEGRHILLAALFLHGFDLHALNGVVSGGWSVAVEMQFYLLLPLIVAWVTSLRRALVLLLGSVLLSAAELPAIEGAIAPFFPASERGLVHDFVFFSLPVQLPVFCAGVLLFRLMGTNSAALRPVLWFLPINAQPRAALLAGLAVAICLPIRWREGVELIPGLPGHIGYGVAFAVLAYALATFPLRPFVNPATRALGTISYSAYLLHFFALRVVEGLLPTLPSLLHLLVLGVGALALTAAAASLTHALIENPGVALGRRLIRRIAASGARTRIGAA